MVFTIWWWAGGVIKKSSSASLSIEMLSFCGRLQAFTDFQFVYFHCKQWTALNNSRNIWDCIIIPYDSRETSTEYEDCMTTIRHQSSKPQLLIVHLISFNTQSIKKAINSL